MCGIGAVFNSENIKKDSYKLGLSFQHRGQESAGWSVSNGHDFLTIKNYGSVNDLAPKIGNIEFNGDRAIFHTRFSTTGNSNSQNTQPVSVGHITLGHNGNLVNAEELAIKYSHYKMKTTVDSELIACILNDSPDLTSGIKRCTEECEGSYNLVALNDKGEVAAFRDPHGYHPLWYGYKNRTLFVASEDICLTGLGIYEHFELKPGELIIANDKNRRVKPVTIAEKNLQKCPFEDDYLKFHGSMSWVPGMSTQALRQELGRRLAKLYPVDADLVVPVPFSGISCGEGYAQESGIRLEHDLCKNQFIGRTYMAADGKGEDVPESIRLSRKEKASLKTPPIVNEVKGKRIILTDDSIVRGNVMMDLVGRLYECGVSEVHVRSAFPPVRYPCFFGMDHGPRSGLIAGKYDASDEQMGEYIKRAIGSNSVAYLPRSEWQKIINDRGDYCWSCVTGVYPAELPQTERIIRLMKA